MATSYTPSKFKSSTTTFKPAYTKPTTDDKTKVSRPQVKKTFSTSIKPPAHTKALGEEEVNEELKEEEKP